ncbi:uncharacterized protein N7511_000641 [Penicillium nucicola]|uniref:uncharacterized protein n=1 Tax=Penicillium nucicola TaxID=1850975 RepID=UPI00254563FA|nr:uncharacterized protein N7511_000641 [Penicillium nucicola]KAJ5775630.1 hypothetical protein N7511_000641 [Penicillium nucicola]
MKLSVLMTSFLALFVSTSSALEWELQINRQPPIKGTGPKGCTPIVIPRGAQISWTGSNGGRTLQLFNTQGKCSQVYRTVMGVGDINASNTIYGYMVKA